LIYFNKICTLAGAYDAIGIYETTELKIKAEVNTHLIFVEVPMERGIKINA
jgi:hypothetical protein